MDEVNQDRKDLKEIRNTPGFYYLVEHINELSKDGWDKFIDLPVAQKTGKAAFEAQANYKVLKELSEWIDSEVKMA